MKDDFRYDVFLSHSSADKTAVRDLAQRLKADGLRVWFDEWEIKPGAMIGLKIQQGLQQSRTLVLALSANASESEWVSFESQSILFTDPTNQQLRLIPLRLDDAEITGPLKQFAYIDWRHRSDEQYVSLLAACRPLEVEIGLAEQVERSSEVPQEWVLRGHTGQVWGVAVMPDGRRAISGSTDRTVRVWDLHSRECLAILQGHSLNVWKVAAAPDGKRILSASADRTVRVWNPDSGECLNVIEGHTGAVRDVAVTPDERRVVSCSEDKTVRVWDIDSGECLAVLEGHTDTVLSVAVTPDGRRVISGSADSTICVWDIDSGKWLTYYLGHTKLVRGVAVTPDRGNVISCSRDRSIRVWDIDSGKQIAILQGHTSTVRGVAVTPDGRRVVSCSYDQTVRVWDIDSGECLDILRGHSQDVNSVAVTPDGGLVVSGSDDRTIRIWKLPVETGANIGELETSRYTNAKVLLVGDSGVGKSGLACRLTEDRFEATVSTDAAWATQMKLPQDVSTKDTEREIWLWDFAGQSDYRLIHQLFMDETALAVLVFNPQSENPFEGLGQWDRDLQRAARRRFRKLLVAGRCDRGGLTVSRASVERFREERGFDGYLETSAYTGDGCAELREAIIEGIPWDDIPWTSSPRIFKLLKEEIVKLKDEGKVLLRMGELKQQLEMRLPGEAFTPEQLRAVVGLLVGPGVVWPLEFGDFVLLQPERINAYAAAVIRSVRAHADEIGCISEGRVLAGDLDYRKPDNRRMERLAAGEEQIVLRAMHQILVEHGICLREHTEAGTLLVFPSYFKRERPEPPGEHPSALVTYRFSGMLDEIYATLVAKLRHTAAFYTDEKWLWRFAADFRTQAGRRVGFSMTKQAEGAAELTVYCEADTAEDTKVTFIRYIHDHLKAKDEQVVRVRHYVCPNQRCGEPVSDARAVEKALEAGRKKIACQYCGKQIPLQDLIEEKFASERIQREVRVLEEQARISIDNESRELILVGHAFAIAGEAGQIFRPTPNSDWGIDGEIEFKNERGEASGKRVYLQLKSGNSYLTTRKGDGKEIFKIKNPRHAEYWQSQAYPVMLVVRTSDGRIRWMDVGEHLSRQGPQARQLVFDGEPFTALSVVRLRDRLFR